MDTIKQDAASTEASIARLDAYRARRIGQMLVGDAPEEFDRDPNENLMNLEVVDGRQLLDEYTKRAAVFGTTPFDPDGKYLRLSPGGVTIWSGFPGSGKTTLLRQFVCHCLARGSSVFMASLEEDPRNVLVGLAAVAAGSELPNVHQMQWFIDAYAARFRLWSVIGLAEHRRILAVIRAVAKQGVRHAVIDSLMCLDISNDDFEAQRRFANLVAATARAAGIHIHLVAHPRKLVSADQELDLNDVAGAREIGGIADNVIFVRRGNQVETATPAAITPMQVCVRKQRHGNGWLGNLGGWYHRGFRQFSPDQFLNEPVRYLPADAYT